MEKYMEVTGEMNKLMYWSNCCGDLHFHGERDITKEELPPELARAYEELWSENGGVLEYLSEYEGKYYLAMIAEYDEWYAEHVGLSMDELYEKVKEAAIPLCDTELFGDSRLILGRESGFDGRHEMIVLYPAMGDKETFHEMERWIYEHLNL